MAHTKVKKNHTQNTGTANTFSYSGSFDVFKGTEVVVLLDNVQLTFTASTINESASPREYTVDTSAKTIHIGGADLSSGTIIIRPETDMGAPTPRATYAPGSSITAEDLNNNQKQLMRKAMEYDETKMSSTGDTMTGHLTMGEDQTIIFEGATDDGYETTLTVTDPTADRTITLPNETGNVIVDTLPSTKIWVGDGAGAAAEVSLSGDVTMANTGEVTIASTAVEQGMIANNAVGADQLGSNAVVNDSVASGAAIEFTKLENLDNTKILVGNSSNQAAEVSMSGDVTIANDGTTTIANDAVTFAKIGCEQTTITDTDTSIPTSGAVVDYVSGQITPLGGFEAIANEDSFPATNPAAGVIISIADTTGITVDSSGVSDTCRQTGSGSDDVRITDFPTTLRGGNGGNANPFPLPNNTGLLVVATGTQVGDPAKDVYTFHRLLPTTDDVKQLSDAVTGFSARYRVHAGEPSSNNDEGDLVYDTNADKMKVYDSTTSAWKDIVSTGDFKYLFLCPAGGTGAPTLDGSIATYDLREDSNSGSVAAVTRASQLLVSINGVVQKPNTGTSAPSEGFALVDGNTIIFGANLASGDSVFIVQFGSALSITTPGNDTVSENSIQTDAVTTGKIKDNAVTAPKTDLSIVQGDIIYGTGTDTWNRLAKGSAGQALIMNSGATAPEWGAAGATIANDANNRVITADGSAGLNGEANLTFDGSTLALTGAATVSTTLGVTGVATVTSQTISRGYESPATVAADWSIGANNNAMFPGPMTVDSGVTVTVPTNRTLTIV